MAVVFLSEHFSLPELTFTQHRDLDNAPGQAELANLKLLATETLEQVHSLLGRMHVDSGYRSPEVNTAVGGSKTSQHCLGLACDFVPLDADTLKEAYEQILGSDIPYDQLIAEYWREGGGWIHISHAPEGKTPRKQALMCGDYTGKLYAAYDPDVAPNV